MATDHVPEVRMDTERVFRCHIVAVRCNNDEDRARLISFFDRVAVRQKPEFAQHPDLVQYHPNPSGLLGFRTFTGSEVLVIFAPEP